MSLQNTTKTMLSLAFKTNVKILSPLISKAEAVSNFPFITLHRTICTSRVFKSRSKLSFNALNAHEAFIASKDPKDLGKTMVLNPEEVEENNEDVSYENSKKSEADKKIKGLRFEEKQNEKKEKSVSSRFDEVRDCDDYDDELDGNEPETEEFKKSKIKAKRKNFKFEKKIKQSLATNMDTFDHDHEKNHSIRISYETLKPRSALFCSTISNLKSRKKREKFNKILIEGRKLVCEAVIAGYQAEMIFFSKVDDVKDLNLPQSTKLFRVSYKDLQLWSDVETSQGIIGVFEKPNLSIQKNNPQSLPLTLICDNIRDPGNMGSILRIATGVGCQKIILTKGCVDIWSLKVTRAAAGAHFQLPMLESLTWPEIANEVLEGSKIILATNLKGTSKNQNDDSPGGKPVTDDHLPSSCYLSQNYCNENVVIIIGGESHGISNEALQFAAERKGVKVYIPMSNNIESLNSGVAFAILSYELRRQVENAKKNESQVENFEKKSNDCRESSSVQSN